MEIQGTPTEYCLTVKDGDSNTSLTCSRYVDRELSKFIRISGALFLTIQVHEVDLSTKSKSVLISKCKIMPAPCKRNGVQVVDDGLRFDLWDRG